VPEPRGHFRESTKLYNWAFANYGFQTLAQPGQVLGKVRVGSGAQDQVEVVAPRSIGVLIKKGEAGAATLDLKLPKIVKAPVKKGSPLGEARVVEQGKVLETVVLQAKEDVPKGSFWRLFDKSFHSLSK
jgi:D-alanyl-D-alanine carboxypeptidase (penicillin-binding protein 5/6)